MKTKTELSDQEKELRKPLPPDILIDALTDPVHIDVSLKNRKTAKVFRSKVPPMSISLSDKLD